MTQRLALVSLIVRDYDEAIAFYTQQVGFTLVEDLRQSADKRWVRVAPSAGGCELLLAQAADDRQRQGIGQQGAGRVWLFLYTDDFWRDHRAMQARGVRFLETPREEPYGIVAVWEDLYGNRWDLLQPKS